MFLSFLPLALNADAHEIHAGLDALYGWNPASGDRPYVWTRTDKGVLARSFKPPVIDGVQTKTEQAPSLGPVTLEVVLNPVRRSDRGERPLLKSAEVQAWAVELLAKSGVQVQENLDGEGFAIWTERISSAPIKSPNKADVVPAHFWKVRVLAAVVDEEKFTAAWKSGIGRKKRYGAGMILAR